MWPFSGNDKIDNILLLYMKPNEHLVMIYGITVKQLKVIYCIERHVEICSLENSK